MTSSVSRIYWNERVQLAQPQTLSLVYSITAATTVTEVCRNPVLTTFTALASQAVIDNFLGTTNEFLLAAFDATAMGADAMGVIINMGGQAAEVYDMKAYCFSASNTVVTRQVEDQAALTASTLETAIAKGANGNIALKLNWGNTPDFDALTAGTIQIDIQWRSK